ncbi:MAG: DDE-type integrase/transposase/recombinase [Phycisphaerales bacterium]|nr:DDE-type integrase/transposase/recombinase [Phycisphaerales bacterium]
MRISIPGATDNGLSVPANWLRAGDVDPAWFGRKSRDSAFRKAFGRCVERNAPALAGKDADGALRLAPEAVHEGLTIAAWRSGLRPRSEMNGCPLPPGAKESWGEADYARFFDTHWLVEQFDELRGSRPRLTHVELVRLCQEAFGAEVGNRARRGGYSPLRLSRKTLGNAEGSYRARLDPKSGCFDGNVDRRGRPTTEPGFGEVSPAAWEFFKALYLDDRRRTVAYCYDTTLQWAKFRGEAWPLGERGVRKVRELVKHFLPDALADYHRLGRKRWRSRFAPRVERDRTAWRPNQVVFIDHTRHNVVAVHGGRNFRPWRTAVVDLASGLALSIIVPKANMDAVRRVLRRWVEKHGAPERLYMDRGRDFGSGPVKSMLDGLGIAVTEAQPYNAAAKGMVERFFRTCDERRDREEETYIGNKPDARPETILKRIEAGAVRAPTLAALQQREDEFLGWFNESHVSPATDGRTRAAAFADNPIPRRTAPAAALELLTRLSTRVKVSKYGITVPGTRIRMGQAELRLLRLQGQEVLIRWDCEDLSSVAVCDLSGKHLFNVTDQALNGVTTDDAREVGRRKARAERAARELGRVSTDRWRSTREMTQEIAAAAGGIANGGENWDGRRTAAGTGSRSALRRGWAGAAVVRGSVEGLFAGATGSRRLGDVRGGCVGRTG